MVIGVEVAIMLFIGLIGWSIGYYIKPKKKDKRLSNASSVKEPTFKSSVLNTNKIKADDIGIYDGYEYYTYDGVTIKINFVIEVKAISTFDNGSVKVIVTQVIDTNVPNEDSYYQVDVRGVLSKHNNSINTDRILVIPQNWVDWEVDEDMDTSKVINLVTSDLATLVRHGGVKLSDVEINLPIDWDYKRALDVIIEATLD